jgi:hypothetical protein
MKKFAIFAVGLLAVIAVAAYLLLGNLDNIVENAVEDIGTELTGTEVSLEEVELELAKGSATLQGLRIDNPEGYSSDYAFLLKKITVAINPASLGKPVIELDEVIVRGARLNVEQRGDTNNLTDLLAKVEKNTSQSAGGQAESAPPSEATDEVRLALKRFVFANTKATLVNGTDGNKAIKVPDVKRNNIGSSAQGLTPEQLGDALLQAVLEEVEAAVADHLASLAKEAVKDSIRDKLGLPDKE